MRATSLVAAAALMLAACGGEKKAEAPAGEAPAAAPAAEAPAAPAATGAVHDVNMVIEGTAYKYVPADLTIKAGDVVRFHNVSGGPHNVGFYADSIPGGAAPVLDAAMKDRMGPLSGPLLVEPNAVYEISFAGAPTGTYKYYCLPPQALGMKGVITIQ